MTTGTAHASSPPTADRRDGASTGTAALLRFMLRRDRVKLPAWTGGLGLFVVYLSSALPNIAATNEELRGATQLFADPVGRLLVGPGYGFDEPTFERFVANGYGLYFLVMAALMNILLVVRHTRVEEQSGRAELVRANVVGPHAPLLAALLVALVTNLVAALVVFGAMVGVGGFGAPGSLLFAAGIAATGLAFAGVAAVTVQLSEYSRAAAGMAGAVLGAAFVVRAGGDMAEAGGSPLSWFSPLAWAQQTAPFVLDRWWPLLLPLTLTVAATTVGYALSARRDLGASWFAVRPGRSRAAPRLGTPIGLALRLNRAGMLGWGSALVVTGLAYGAYADALLGAFDDMPDAFRELFGAQDMLGGYLAYIAMFTALLAGAYAVMAVQGLRNEEASGRAEPVLATPMSRSTWMGVNFATAAGGVVVLLAAAGLATGMGAALATGDTSYIGELLVAHLNHIPSVWVVLGVTALLYGVVPRAVPVGWALVVYALVVGTFGPLLDLPSALFDLSPFEHPAPMPLEPFAPVPAIVLTLVAAATAALGMLAFRRRDLQTA